MTIWTALKNTLFFDDAKERQREESKEQQRKFQFKFIVNKKGVKVW